MQNKDENPPKDSISDGGGLNEFLQRNRKGILIIGIIALVLLVGLVVFFVVSDNLEKKAIAEVEELSSEYDKLLSNINNEEYSDDVNNLLERLEVFAGSKKGYAASKAWSLAAYIYMSREDWVKSEETWVKSAAAGAKTYLGPIAYFQAAIAAEEQNKFEQAIEHLKMCTAHSFEFPDAPRAQFNIGRIYEQLGNKTLAIEAYRAVLLNYQWEYDPMNPVNLLWHNLARNQIIKLEL